MSKMIKISLIICVFFGKCLYSNAENYELRSQNWKQMVEIRLMKLENEFNLQSKENERIKEENTFLRSQFQDSKDRETELLKLVSEMKSDIEKLEKSQNHPAKNHPKHLQMEMDATGINHTNAELVRRIGKLSIIT